MFKKPFRCLSSFYLALIFSLQLILDVCAHQNKITEAQHAASEYSSVDDEFWSSLEPILTSILPELYDSSSQVGCLPAMGIHQDSLDIGKTREGFNLQPLQVFENTGHSEEAPHSFHQALPQLNLDILNPTEANAESHEECESYQGHLDNDNAEHIFKHSNSPIISVPDFYSHIPDRILSYRSNDLARDLLHSIYDQLDNDGQSIELHEAKKIWNARTILPFVYFAISHATDDVIIQRSIRYAACLFAAYHKRFSFSSKERNHKNLYSFLVWITDIFHQITSPRLIFHSSVENEHKQIQELGRIRRAHPVARLFLELRGFQQINPSLTCLGHRHHQYFTCKFIEAWEKDRVHFIHQHSLTQVAILWEDWHSKAERIMAHGLTLSPLILPAIPNDRSQTQVFDSVYKCATGFSYLVDSFLLKNPCIWGVAKEDTTNKILYAFLNQPRASSTSNIFWYKFLTHRDVTKSRNKARKRNATTMEQAVTKRQPTI
ncbi:hypothetical protein DFH28DRAFT_948177 [Melampsora americana]|nr:hypothetical protein DFH28DRAFT_948177 [Melampsora americana]